ncbi:MAG: hypothetical protein QM820_34290 [Minicystis sp.]
MLLVADLSDATAGEDVDELLLAVVGVEDERLLARRDAHQVDADAR